MDGWFWTGQEYINLANVAIVADSARRENGRTVRTAKLLFSGDALPEITIEGDNVQRLVAKIESSIHRGKSNAELARQLLVAGSRAIQAIATEDRYRTVVSSVARDMGEPVDADEIDDEEVGF